LTSIFSDTEIKTVYHLAAHRPGGGTEDEDAMAEANVRFDVRLLNAMAGGDCRTLVNAGSYWQFNGEGERAPNSLYATAKQEFQDILADRVDDYAIRAVSLVLFDIYGPGDWRGGVTAALCRAAQGEIVDMTGGEQVLDMVYVSDVVDAFLTAGAFIRDGKIGNPHQHYFIGSGQRAGLREIATVFEAACERPLALNWGALDYRRNQIFSPCPAEPALPGWEPRVSLDEGFAGIVREMHLGVSA
jgi:nucleoside-diphosphate-sugar epimerase